MKQHEFSHTPGGSVKWCSHFRQPFGSIFKSSHAYLQSKQFYSYVFIQKKETLKVHKKLYVRIVNFLHNSPQNGNSFMLTNRGMDTLMVVYFHNGTVPILEQDNHRYAHQRGCISETWRWAQEARHKRIGMISVTGNFKTGKSKLWW